MSQAAPARQNGLGKVLGTKHTILSDKNLRNQPQEQASAE